MGHFNKLATRINRKQGWDEERRKICAQCRGIQKKLIEDRGRKGSLNHTEKRELINNGQAILLRYVSEKYLKKDPQFVIDCVSKIIGLEQQAPELESCNQIAEMLETTFGGLDEQHLSQVVFREYRYTSDGRGRQETTVKLYEKFQELGCRLKEALTNRPLENRTLYIDPDVEDETSGEPRGNVIPLHK